MDIVLIIALVLAGVLFAGVAGIAVVVGISRLDAAQRRARIRAEQYRSEAELQRLTQVALRQMFEAARLDARLRTPSSSSPPSSGRIQPSPSDLEGEAWDGNPGD